MTNIAQDFTDDERFVLMRSLNRRLLTDSGDPSDTDMSTIKLQHAVGKRLLPETSGHMIIPTIYGFPIAIDIDKTHTDTMQGSIERNLYFMGTYEAGTLDIMKRSLESWGKGACFVDIGAHNGLMSIFAAHQGAGRVVAFEPYAPMFKLLQENIVLSNKTNIEPHQHGLSDHKQTVSMVANDQNSGATRIVQEGEPGDHEIQVDTLDQIVKDEGIERINLMLIDVEGHEIHVLKGAREVILRDKPDLIVEYDPRHQDQEVVDFLKGHGYHLFILERSRHQEGRLLPFDSTAANNTLMDNLFCFQEERAQALGLGS
jgi:FkbM family methyltransferase